MHSKNRFSGAVILIDRLIAVLPGRHLTPQDRLLLSHITIAIRELSREFDGSQLNTMHSRIGPRQRSAIFAADLLDFVSPDMSMSDYLERVDNVSALWNDELARRWPRRHEFARTMREQLFERDDDRWRAYAACMRRKLPWFGRHAA